MTYFGTNANFTSALFSLYSKLKMEHTLLAKAGMYNHIQQSIMKTSRSKYY